MTTLEAACENCASWTKNAESTHESATTGMCARSLVPDAGQPLCGEYEAGPAFTQALISAMMKDIGPMAMPVKLVGMRGRDASGRAP